MYKYIRKIPKNNMNKYMNRDAWSIRKDREKGLCYGGATHAVAEDICNSKRG